MSAAIENGFRPRIRIEEGEIVRADLQRKNALNTGAWWAKFAGGVHCPDLRDDDLRSRGRLIAVRMQFAIVAVRSARFIRELDKARRDLDGMSNIVMFKRQAG